MDKTFWIDGMESLEKGKTVLQIARKHGITYLPLCYHPRTGPASMCRVCVVEVDGMRGLQTYCTLLPREDMVIHTDTPRVLEARKTVVNLLLANGNHNCISCDANGDCELQDAAYQLGIE